MTVRAFLMVLSACGGINASNSTPLLTAYFPVLAQGILGKDGSFVSPPTKDCLTGMKGLFYPRWRSMWCLLPGTDLTLTFSRAQFASAQDLVTVAARLSLPDGVVFARAGSKVVSPKFAEGILLAASKALFQGLS